MTALAPPPGREAGSGGAGPSAPAGAEAAPDDTVDVVDLTTPRRRPGRTGDPAAQASWVFGLALALLSEEVPERVVLAEVLTEAAGHPRALEGAYGRAVALLGEFPDGTLVHRTVDLLAKALLRSRRPERAEEA